MKEEGVIELLVNITKKERKCEIARQLLNDKVEFEPYALFSRIDRLNQGYINQEDLINFLKDNNFFIQQGNKKGVSLFFEYYDRNFDGVLNFEEFLNFILTRTHPLLRTLATQKKTYKLSKRDYFNHDIETLVSTLLIKEFSLFQYVDSKKLEIMTEFDNDSSLMNLLEMFSIIDIDGDGFISAEDIEVYLRVKGIVLYQEAISSLISLYDEDLDGKLNWNEYLLLILPSQNSYSYNFEELQRMENKYIEIYHDSLRADRLTKDASKAQRIDQSLIRTSENMNLSVSNSQNVNMKSIRIDDEPKSQEVEEIPKKEKDVENTINNVNSGFEYSDSRTRDYTECITEHKYPTISNNFIEFFTQQLLKIIDVEREIENTRINLACIESFNLISIFKYFDRVRNQYVAFEDFFSRLNSLGMSVDPHQASLIFDTYDRQRNGKIRYSDFIEMFLPKTLEEAITLTRRNPLNKEDISTNSQVVNEVQKLFSLMIKSEKFLREIKKSMINPNALTLILDYIDVEKNGYLRVNEFNTLFEKYGVEVKYEDLRLLMEKIDKDKDGKVFPEEVC